MRPYFVKRVCVLGAESTGTTTLARALAIHYKTVWVPEFGRMYWEAKMSLSEKERGWNTEEFVFIAEEQNRIEDELAKISGRVLVCDTDSFATSLWHERYMGFASKEVERKSRDRKCDLYLLTDVDMPFVQDGTRDGRHIRHAMHKRFEEALKKHQKPFCVLSGSRKKRLKDAIIYIDKIIAAV